MLAASITEPCVVTILTTVFRRINLFITSPFFFFPIFLQVPSLTHDAGYIVLIKSEENRDSYILCRAISLSSMILQLGIMMGVTG
ncbi:hypothetical protein I7I48_07548 [Histoplasma ohiense]|nr:hypothetical protein I7I48_07548 [Histoplasma ohiense (nom. inval.)]